ncbi:MAG: tRNA (adenosine(37)-N6)-threonylcarbamoyltransferase complex transferase subunit TsaD [Leadbetterella sp.]
MKNSNITILAIESSCDETSASVIKNGIVLSNVISTQIIHEKHGGVVPELASRAHQQDIVKVVFTALENANCTKNELSAIAFTKGPGLLGSLLVGVSFAKTFAKGLSIPIIEIDHMQAHVLAHMIDDPKPPFPFLCLTVSGGHTQIIRVHDPLHMEILGQTLDDAVGEAFDKASKMLNLGYPGGPKIDALAKEGDPMRFSFPIAEIKDLDFSFSGVKTALLYFLQKKDSTFIKENIHDICASYQYTLIKTLLQKLKKASKNTGIKHIALAGGVSANKGLRLTLIEMAEKEKWSTYIPDFQYCTDNAGMIAIAAHYKFLNQNFANWDIQPEPRLTF